MKTTDAINYRQKGKSMGGHLLKGSFSQQLK